MSLDHRALLTRVRLEVDLRGQDLQRGESDLQADLHVMDGQGLRIEPDVEPRWLLIAHAASDQDPIRGEPIGANPILAIVEDGEALGIRGEDRIIGERHETMKAPQGAGGRSHPTKPSDRTGRGRV